MKILKIVVLAEFEDKKIRQVHIQESIMQNLFTAIATSEGALTVFDPPIEGLLFAHNDSAIKTRTREECIHFDECQGRDHCCNPHNAFNNCIGIECGKAEFIKSNKYN